MEEEKRQALLDTLVKEVGKDQAEKIVGEIDAAKEADKGAKVGIDLPADFEDKITAAVAKANEALEKAQKKFKFTDDKVSKKALSKVERKAIATKYIRDMYMGDLDSATKAISERAEKLGQKALGSTSGAVLVPEIFETEIWSNFDTYNEIISDANVATVNTPGNVINYNELGAKVIVYLRNEGNQTTASTPTYTNPDLYFDEYAAETVLYDIFMEDQEADIMSNLSAQFSEQFAKKIQDRLVNNATSNKQGLFAWSGTSVVTAGSTGSYLNATVADLQKLETELMATYNKSEGDSGKYYMHTRTYDAIWNNTVTAGSAYGQFALNPFEGRRKEYLGHPVRLVNEIATPTVTGTKFVLFGDLSKHLIVRRKRGLRMTMNSTGTAAEGINLNTSGARQLVMDARLGQVVVLPAGLYFLQS